MTPTWTGIWSDLPGHHSVSEFRWLDDRSLMTFQRDAVTTEVALRNCPREFPLGENVLPLSFCSRGVKALVVLGNERAAVLKHWNVEKPKMVGNAVLLTPADGPFDAFLVYFEDGDAGKAVKILGQYRTRLQGTDATAMITEVWRNDMDHLGAVRRQDVAKPPQLQAWNWHDDVTRVRVFGQQTETGPRMYCEWRELPIPVEKTAKR